MSVPKYIQEFKILTVRSQNTKTLEQSIARFIIGLRYEIANVIDL